MNRNQKIHLIRRQHFFKGRARPITVTRGTYPRGSFRHVDTVVFRYVDITEARVALIMLQDMATDCSYHLKYPNNAIKLSNNNRKLFNKIYGKSHGNHTAPSYGGTA